MNEIENALITNPAAAAGPIDEKPWREIYVAPGSVSDNLRDAIAGLAETGEHFQSAGRIVTLRKAANGDMRIEPLSRNALFRDLDHIATWQRMNPRTNEFTRCDPPGKICRILNEPGAHAGLPELRGIARQPHLRKDGSICDKSGYDALTGLFGAFDAADWSIPVAASRAQAEAALRLLDGLLQEFEFADAGDRSAALSAILTAAVRPSLAAAPMYHVKGSQIGSGKSYLTELIAAFATDKPAAAVPFPSSSEECAKLLTAELMRGPAVLEFDNLTTDILPHKTLCSALTQEFLRNRELGHTRIVEVGTRAVFLSSGNNVGPVKDMTRRCITIRLDPKHEVPATRSFKRPSLVNEVKAERGKYVGAALTVVRAWIVAGNPMTICKPLGSYSDWTDWCRQPLLWLGLEDPAKSVFQAMAHDPDRELVGKLVSELQRVFGTKHFLVKEIIQRAQDGGTATQDLLEVLQEIAPDRSTINRRQLGQWIKAHAGRWVDGVRIEEAPVKRNSAAWQIAAAPSIVMPASTREMLPIASGVSTSARVDAGATFTVDRSTIDESGESGESGESIVDTPSSLTNQIDEESDDSLDTLLDLTPEATGYAGEIIETLEP